MREWYLLYTKPHKEQAVRQSLDARGIEAYVPLVRARGRHGVWGLRPFFPCYLFARTGLETKGLMSVQWIPGLRKVVGFGSRPTVVPKAVVDRIRQRLTEVKERGGVVFQPGQGVVVREGPLRDLDAIFERELPATDRVWVLIKILGRLTSCEVDVSWLEAP